VTARARALLRRPVVELGASELTLSLEDTASVLREDHGVSQSEIADVVHRVTAGWPALVHLAVALVGIDRDSHLAAARKHAERARDVVQLARVLLLQSNTLLGEARYKEALEATVRALRVAEAGAPPGLLVTALYNVGEAALRVGRRCCRPMRSPPASRSGCSAASRSGWPGALFR
jgi:hypothetical protein